MKKISNSQNAFTLIELLVVVAIIGILSAVIMANFVGFRERGRDVLRKSDLKQIQAALEFYRSDNGSYPTGTYPSSCGTTGDSIGNGSTTYMKIVPCDPSSTTSSKIKYSYSSDGTTYTLYACLENPQDSQKDSTPHSGCTTSYTVTNP